MKLYWRNNQTAEDEYYSSRVPNNNPIGSIICCWNSDINGDNGYQDLIYEISDTNILEYPNQIGRYTDLKVLKKGEVQVIIYAKYNSNLKYTFNISVG